MVNAFSHWVCRCLISEQWPNLREEGSNDLGRTRGFPWAQFPTLGEIFQCLVEMIQDLCSHLSNKVNSSLPKQESMWRMALRSGPTMEAGQRAVGPGWVQKSSQREGAKPHIHGNHHKQQHGDGPFLQVCLSCNETSRGRVQWPRGRKSARLCPVPFQNAIASVVHSLLVYLV